MATFLKLTDAGGAATLVNMDLVLLVNQERTGCRLSFVEPSTTFAARESLETILEAVSKPNA